MKCPITGMRKRKFSLCGPAAFSLSLDGESMELSSGEAAFFPAGSLHAGTPHDCVYECIVFDLRMLLSAPDCAGKRWGKSPGGRCGCSGAFIRRIRWFGRCFAPCSKGCAAGPKDGS